MFAATTLALDLFYYFCIYIMMKIIRRKSNIVPVGKVFLGDNHPVAIQSMTNTQTNDIISTVSQIKSIAAAGADMVRVTVPGMKEVEALKEIKKSLITEGYDIPLIADVHFSTKVAEAAAAIVDKVRINPGNFMDKKVFNEGEMTEKEYLDSMERMASKARPLLEICKKHNTTLRIGVNHGSLCDRIINKYGNGPLGMVMSAMEWVHICDNYDFHNVVFSMKASQVSQMMEASLLLVSKMEEAGKVYPIHLGVTEAGSGLEGRVKSAAGTGALLLMGIGDTIRVSLTEKPENEIPVAGAIIQAVEKIEPEWYTVDPDGILTFSYPEKEYDLWIVEVAAIVGYEHYHQKITDLIIKNPCFSPEENRELALAVLQACRIKMSRTEIISCPTCGRTQFNIERIVDKVKKRFGTYPDLKLGVMGCIVNGPGEMADADYGIVGATNNNVAVYEGKNRISAIIPEDEGLALLEKILQEKGYGTENH